MTRPEYTEIIKAAAYKVILNLVLKQIISAVPFFSLSIPGYFLKIVVTKILSIAFESAAMRAFFSYIDLRVGDEKNEFQNAALKNAIAQGGTDENEKIIAENNLIDAFKRFAKLQA